jgi:hypothetical protein
VALTGKLKLYLRADATEADTSAAVGARSALLRHLLEFGETTYDNGTGANQVNRVYSATTTATTTPTDLDLAGGLTAMDGSTITMAEVVAIAIVNKSTTTSENLQIGGDANSVPIFGAVGDYAIVGPGGVFLWSSPVDGVTVTASTGDILQIAASTGTITYDILIVGRTS